MELRLSLLLAELLMMICFLSLQALAGLLSLPSLSSASSVIFPIKVKTHSDIELYEIRHRFLLLDNDNALSPTSAHTKPKPKAYETDPESIQYHKTHHAQSPSHHPLTKDSNPRKPNIPQIPSFKDPTKKEVPSYSPSSSASVHKSYHHNGEKSHHIAPEPHHSISRKRSGSSPSSKNWNPKGHLPFPAIPHNHINAPSPSPSTNPVNSPTKNNGCENVKCTESLTYTARGAPCGCVLPIEVSLRFSISLYNFFPLVSELSREIAKGLSLDRSQVRILGADAADHQQEKTTVLVNLVPLNDKFDADTAFSIYRMFWTREISVTFGSYEVLYVHYTGLPPSPPSPPDGSATIEAQPYMEGNDNNGPLKPIGVNITTKRKNSSDTNMVIIIILSAVTAFAVITGFIVLSLSKSGCFSRQERMHAANKESGGRFLTLRSKPSSGSMSFSSNLVAFAGSAKIFTIHEMERATDGFSASRVLGEGGFGIVYGGVLEDGRNAAVKVLKRDNKQVSREFLAEVEMLSRLHHRNLVKLIGICAEEQLRCLVYELIPNGSVESHLHGADKEVAPLDWPSRMKIALGAARGLAYLHEDSSPRVIHRDFKSSNILLEHDYTPKVSDFGLARMAMEDENKHVSTHVMGTFGYLAPEYAMTGHVLVKSDVYSYGVVLLELLTGRKPVDLTQPHGQENLVSWARPLLITKEGLEALIDPVIKAHVPLENFAKVAAIASMLVQPEVSHRPFMGEVVQALKLVCNEIEETRDGSMSWSRDEMMMSFSVDAESKHSRITNELLEDLEREECMFEESRYGSGIAISDVELKRSSAEVIRGRESESFRREFNSAPLKVERKRRFWQKLGRFSIGGGSMSEHEYLTRL